MNEFARRALAEAIANDDQVAAESDALIAKARAWRKQQQRQSEINHKADIPITGERVLFHYNVAQSNGEAKAWAEATADEIGAAVGRMIGRTKRELRAEIAEVRRELREELISEIGNLRADAAIDRAFPRGEVIELPPFIRKRDNAA